MLKATSTKDYPLECEPADEFFPGEPPRASLSKRPSQLAAPVMTS